MSSSAAAAGGVPIRAEIQEVEGPVLAARAIEIDAPPSAIWAVLTDFARWGDWNPEVKAVTVAPGELAAGLVFRWKTGSGTIESTILEASPPARIAWSGRTPGIRALHVWRLETKGDRTLVHTEESFRGPVAWLLRAPLRRVLSRSLDRSLRHLKAAIQNPTGAG